MAAPPQQRLIVVALPQISQREGVSIMPGSNFSGLQKLVALSIITLVALIAVSQINTFSPRDADGTATGSAVNIGTYSGNGGGGFSAVRQAPRAEEDAGELAT